MVGTLLCIFFGLASSLANAAPPILKQRPGDTTHTLHNKASRNHKHAGNKHIQAHESSTNAQKMLPSSCIGLDDGYHWLKLLEDTEDTTYPMVYAQCSNEFMMIDYSVDENWSSYFTTWYKYHYAVAGPSRNEQYNWPEWFLPDRERISYSDDEDQLITGSGSFRVSPDCSTCASNDDVDYQLNDDQSAYYMSALAFGCFDPTRGWPACDQDYDSYTCKLCEWLDDGTQITSMERPITMTYETIQSAQNGIKAGVCDFNIRSSLEAVEDSFSKCAIEGSPNRNWKPSLGLGGSFCQCYKPTAGYGNVNYGKSSRKNDKPQSRPASVADKKEKPTSDKSKHPHHIAVDMSEYDRRVLEREFSAKEVLVEHMVSERDRVYQVYQTDFEDGTYRIQKSGTYVFMEDIVLNFNPAPDGTESPNNIDDDYWWPQDSDAYPGAMQARDAYFLGYFAGITVEVDDVTLDLNGFEIRMAKEFYYQQPYFSIIELENQPFLPQQGPGFFGSDPFFPSNVIIKNGVLGLSSHHAIHGNFNNDVEISNLRVKDFQTHGIQLNGYNTVTIKDVEIGPTSDMAYLNGNYGHLRLILPTLEKIAEDSDSAALTTIRFKGREEGLTMWDLLNKVIVEMDMAFDFVMTGTTYEEHPWWQEAQDMFINPSGLPYGAVLYGLFLNYPSAGIFGWHVNDQLSYDATVENVYIHDLRHKGIEVVGFQSGGRVFCNAFNGPLSAKDTFGADDVWNVQSQLYGDEDLDRYEMQYHGSIITDIWLAQYFWGNNNYDYWPGIPYLGSHDQLLEWATGTNDDYMAKNEANMYFSCNEDAMFHPAKGLLGFKASGTEGMSVKNLRIENIQDETPLGSELCGSKDTYHFSQQEPYQVGYSMNMVMGISFDFMTSTTLEDISVSNLVSDTGLVYGMAAWFESSIEFKGQLTMANLHSGFSIEDDAYAYDDRPNKAPETCAVRQYDDTSYPLTITFADDLVASQTCMKGAVGCLGESTDTYTHYDTATAMDGDDSCSSELAFPYAPASMKEVIPKIRQRAAEYASHAEFVVMKGSGHKFKQHQQPVGGKEVSFVTLILAIAAVAVCASMKALWDCRLRELKRLNVSGSNGSYRPWLRYLMSNHTESTPLMAESQ